MIFVLFTAENCLFTVYENLKYYILAPLVDVSLSELSYFSLLELILSNWPKFITLDYMNKTE